MELLLINLVALVRPLASTRFADQLFQLLAVGFLGALMLSLVLNTAIRKSLRLSAIDGLIIAFTIWGIATSVIYFQSVDIGHAAKLLIPPLSYLAVKNVIHTREQYRTMLLWMAIGFSVPMMTSAILIALGDERSIAMTYYYTGLDRWQGAYDGSHSLGHSATLFLIVITLYFSVGMRQRKHPVQLHKKISGGFLALVALYCLYMSQVRSATLGLFIFTAVFLFNYNRKALVIGAAVFAVVASLTVSYWFPTFLKEFELRSRGIDVPAEDLGAGRPKLWMSDINTFKMRPIDQKLAGAGIGNSQVKGHNDWLEIIMQTGIFGFCLYVALWFAILRGILRMEVEEKWAYFAIFVALIVMMFVSNAYAWRIQVSQLYYMILAFIEMRVNRSATEDGLIKV